jgi:hypothetical protein
LINTGGGDPATEMPQGIHWHMNISIEIDFVATDEHRQVIPYIHVKDAQGRVTEYFAQDSKLTRNKSRWRPSAVWIARIATAVQLTTISHRNRPSTSRYRHIG